MDHFGPAISPDEDEKLKSASKPVTSVSESTRALSTADSSSSDDDCYGPALPPGLGGDASKSTDVVGPLLPPHLMIQRQESESDTSDSEAAGDEDNAGDAGGYSYGPLPPSAAGDQGTGDSVERLFEARAERMRKKLEPQKEELHREEWMTALPSKKSAALGLTARKFKGSSSYVKDEDCSIWTDTPADRKRKAAESKEKKKKKKDVTESVPVSVLKQNEELRQQSEEYNALHRGESLMSLHQKKRKADIEAGTVTKKPALEPFDPERDMQPEMKLDPSARNKVIANARKLDNRFHRSATQSHFL